MDQDKHEHFTHDYLPRVKDEAKAYLVEDDEMSEEEAIKYVNSDEFAAMMLAEFLDNERQERRAARLSDRLERLADGRSSPRPDSDYEDVDQEAFEEEFARRRRLAAVLSPARSSFVASDSDKNNSPSESPAVVPDDKQQEPLNTVTIIVHGQECIVVDRNTQDTSRVPPGGHYCYGDLSDPAFLDTPLPKCVYRLPAVPDKLANFVVWFHDSDDDSDEDGACGSTSAHTAHKRCREDKPDDDLPQELPQVPAPLPMPASSSLAAAAPPFHASQRRRLCLMPSSDFEDDDEDD